MKISRVEISNFRGFPGPGSYVFDLDGGKNLAVYGDNGSGKSSLFRALDEFFNLQGAMPFDAFHNIFAKDEHGVPLTNGHITLHFTEAPSPLKWETGGSRHTSDSRIVEAGWRKGCLEYRSLLRTNFVEGPLDERLFYLAASILLAGIPVPLPGGAVRRLGTYWKAVHRPTSHHRRVLQRAEESINRFNDAMKAILPDVQAKTSEILNYFSDHRLMVTLDYAGLRYDRKTRKIVDDRLSFRVTFNGKPITAHEQFLNEARLSALALSLFLASVLLSNPTPPPDAKPPLKLLVLDDVLIGLDLCHRLPLLDILNHFFGDYQVFLLTFDRVWFDMVHMLTERSGQWVYQELYARHVGDPGYDIPLHKTAAAYIQRAKEHVSARDYRAAAVYARAAFEVKLGNFCTHKKLLVEYEKDPAKVTSEQLWKAVTGKHGGDGTSHVDAAAQARIEALRKVYLNPLSHSGSNSITDAEVQQAILALESLTLT